jgi:hypothetical protein
MHKFAPFCYVLRADPLYVSEPRLKFKQNFMEHSTSLPPLQIYGQKEVKRLFVLQYTVWKVSLTLLPRRH